MEILDLFTGEMSYRLLHCTVTDQYTSAPTEHYSLQTVCMHIVLQHRGHYSKWHS